MDSPFALNPFREDNRLAFDFISDANHGMVDAYDATMSFEDMDVDEVTKRAMFVVDSDGEITPAWRSDDPGVEPDYDEIETAAADA